MILQTILCLIAAALFFLIAGNVYLKWYFTWEMGQRRGLNYYGRPLAERRKFKEALRLHGFFLKPFITIEAKFREAKKVYPDIPSIEYNGITGPSYSCSAESFQKAAGYKPSSQDIFVVTQMKCGTTWMQQIVYQVLYHGKGSFGDEGHRHLYAVSPWIEAIDGVSIEEASLLGETKKKLIKTHMPVELCPFDVSAKYIYVARHPVSCFASIEDYFKTMAGPLAPPHSKLVNWYCSKKMWWTPWPDHVAGWWDRAHKNSNVLFLHFEDMKKDPATCIRKVAEFLGVTLSSEELADVVHQSSFDVMKSHEEFFEMTPPNVFSVSNTYFKSGRSDRHAGVDPDSRKAILDFCSSRLSDKAFPFERIYADAESASKK